MTEKVQMTALQSRAAGSSPTGRALDRGETYSVTEEQARAEEARGFGARVAEEPSAAPRPRKRRG